VESHVPIHLNHRLELATRDADRVRLTFATPTGAPHSPAFDHVVAATGYRIDIDRLGCLDPQLRARIARTDGNWPRLERGFQSSVPGLYFVGLAAAATFGPLMRFVCGTRFAALQVSLSAARRARLGPQT
jgi:hypothetical protein